MAYNEKIGKIELVKSGAKSTIAHGGVVIKSYPRTKNNSKFYLYEAIIIEADSPSMTAPQLSVDTVGESALYSKIVNSNTEKVKISSKDGVLLNWEIGPIREKKQYSIAPKESDISEEERNLHIKVAQEYIIFSMYYPRGTYSEKI